MRKLINFINWIKLYFERGETMMVIFFLVNRIILGRLEFKDVPEVLKDEVRQELIDNGLEFLITE